MRKAVSSKPAGALLALAAAALALAVPSGGAKGADWPQWRGPRRDNVSTETGLLKKWPEGGPRLLWTARGCGKGFSTVSVANGLIYTTGDIGQRCFILAFGLDGQLRWKTPIGKAWTKEEPGARSTPTVADGKVYALTGHGELACLDARTGKRLWWRDVVKDFGGQVIRWGIAESVIVDGHRLICTPGGKNACMVALDTHTGKTLWTTKGASFLAGHASPIIFEFAGLRQVVTLTRNGLVAAEVATGRVLWHYGPRSSDWHVLTPIYADGAVFFVGPYGIGTKVAIAATDGKLEVSPAWEIRIENHHGGMLLLDGYLYGHDKNNWCCINFATGKRMWVARGIGKGSLTYADGMLYCLSERGTVALVRATPKAFELVSKFRIPRGGSGPTWAHPVVCGGRLYIRHGDYLYAFGIRAER